MTCSETFQEALTVLGKAWETERVGSAATEEEIGIASKLGSEASVVL